MRIISPITIKRVATGCIAGWMAVATSVAMAARTDLTNTVSIVQLRTPAKAQRHFERAREAAIAGRESEYEQELARALEIDPNFSEAYLLRASHEVALQRYAAGIEDALIAQRLEPGIAWAAIVHAGACNGLERYDEAFELLQALRPSEAETWQAKYEMTRTAVGRGDTGGALRWSALTLAAAPANRADAALLLRANALQMAHRWAEAITQMRAYLASPRPQPARAQVLAILESTERRAREEEVAGLATH